MDESSALWQPPTDMESPSDSRSDSRFDPCFLAQLLVDISHEQSVDALLKKLVIRATEHRDILGAQIWLVDKGDGSLYAAAASGKLPPGSDTASARMAVGAGVVGEIAASRKGVVLYDSGPEWPRLADPRWLKANGVRGFKGEPIVFKGELLGVTASYYDHHPPVESRPWGEIFANHIAAAIANARAFEEIQTLKAQLEHHNAYLEEEVVEARAFGDLVGQSAELRQIISQINLVAPTEASVLVLGETGTGKELVAREIHQRSARKDKPLVRVNCASIPKDLFESEFFGHVKGAFTGAIKDRAGRFETAQNGSLFLDEIGEVPLEMQSKLLRVLQEKRYERVGDDRTRQADVRIIAATNRDLKKAAAEGRFREDLYYRLCVFPIHVTPLREHMEDIPSLAEHFVRLSTKELKCSKPRLTNAVLAKLQNYDWPGNVRELRNVIERAVILARGGLLDFDLPVATPSSPRFSSRADPWQHGMPASEILTEPELQRRERENLLAVLEKANWKIKGPDGAAELLGVKPTTLLSRMKKWGLKKPERGPS